MTNSTDQTLFTKLHCYPMEVRANLFLLLWHNWNMCNKVIHEAASPFIGSSVVILTAIWTCCYLSDNRGISWTSKGSTVWERVWLAPLVLQLIQCLSAGNHHRRVLSRSMLMLLSIIWMGRLRWGWSLEDWEGMLGRRSYGAKVTWFANDPGVWLPVGGVQSPNQYPGPIGNMAIYPEPIGDMAIPRTDQGYGKLFSRRKMWEASYVE